MVEAVSRRLLPVRARLGLLLTVAIAGVGCAGRAAAAVSPATSFVTATPLSQPDEIDAYSLKTGAELRAVAHIHPLPAPDPDPYFSQPQLLSNGDYLYAISHGARCRRSGGKCRAIASTCVNRIDALNPTTRAAQTLFTAPDGWRVWDAVPSPTDSSLALTETTCLNKSPRVVVRSMSTGAQRVVATNLPECWEAGAVAWTPDGSRLVFPYGTYDGDVAPQGCQLALVPSAGGAKTIVHTRPSCGFASAAFDAKGLVAALTCSDGEGGGVTRLLQYAGTNRVVAHGALESWDPPQYSSSNLVVNDPEAHTVLVTGIVSDDPDDTEVWTWSGTRLHLVDDYFGNDLLAEP